MAQLFAGFPESLKAALTELSEVGNPILGDRLAWRLHIDYSFLLISLGQAKLICIHPSHT
jgi:hypothetical protein